jgi:MSHA pilin protein MshA
VIGKAWSKLRRNLFFYGVSDAKIISNRGQKGFTLIELIVVIVILGILAATALPRFLNAAQSARISSIQGVQGSVNSAIAIVHAQYLIQGGSPTVVNLDGGTPVNLFGGYPDATALGIGNAINYTAANYTFTPGAATTAATATFQVTSAPTPANCQVTYISAAAPAANGAATAPPSTTIDVTKC